MSGDDVPSVGVAVLVLGALVLAGALLAGLVLGIVGGVVLAVIRAIA